MADDGETKDDVKMPDGEIGDKIKRLFVDEEKDTSKSSCLPRLAKIPQRFLTFYLDVVILTSMGEQLAVEAKEAPRSG
jgi:translation initiation factor 5A